MQRLLNGWPMKTWTQEKKVHAATFHDGVGELVDMEEVSEESKNQTKCLFGSMEAERKT